MNKKQQRIKKPNKIKNKKQVNQEKNSNVSDTYEFSRGCLETLGYTTP